MKHKILIVEDEDSIRIGLQDNFELEDYAVEVAEDGEEALEIAASFQPDLVLLDLMLPKKSGYEVCRLLRKKMPNVYIIMLTAKNEESSKVTGLEMGADDYVTKPFSILELLARVKAFLRRSDIQGNQDSSSTLSDEIIKFADIEINFKKFEATKASIPLDMNTREYQILQYFWEHRGEVILREDLLQHIWGYSVENMPSTRTIDNHIVKLRQKLENEPAAPKMIISIRGAGYKFDV
jgi:DNA-binding response OmpR family regulator